MLCSTAEPTFVAMLFRDVIGQAALKEKLIGNIREQRIAHAQLFLGPRGSGNLPLALAYAQYLLCEQKGDNDSCGTCSACLQTAKLEHPDLHLAFPIYLNEKIKTCDHFIKEWRSAVLKRPYMDIDQWRDELESENKQLRMGVDIAHDIQRRLSLRSFRGGYKVILIWQAELMDAPASNKLLKVLEEPEPKTVFVLVSNDAEQLLATIISRAQLTKVPALRPGDIAAAIQQRFPEIPADEAGLIGVRSDGDLLEAVDMAEKGEEDLFDLFRGWLLACFQLNVVEVAEFTEQFQKMGRERQKTFLRYALQMIRQCVLQWQQTPDLVRVMGREQEFVQKFSRLLTDHNADRIRQELEQAHHHIERNANPKILFMDMSYRIMGLLKVRA
jgi:DNA polymerase III subunit delta'